MKAGNAKTNMEIEGGLAYLELLENGVSEETARTIATGVGAVNAGLEFLQLDELVKAYKVLDKIGADDSFAKIVFKEVIRRGIDVTTETGQEVAQEVVTIAGTQAGSKFDTGEWAYSADEVVDRLKDATKSSALTFGLTNLPAAGNNMYAQSHAKLVAEGYAKLRSGEMPNAAQLNAMGLNEPDARGKIVLFQMEKMDDAAEGGVSSSYADGTTGIINTIPNNASTIGHIFRDAEGHIPDTPQNRALLESVANSADDFLGYDKYGNAWYTRKLSDGSYAWVEARNGNIFEGGINQNLKPWNSDTGLKKP